MQSPLSSKILSSATQNCSRVPTPTETRTRTHPSTKIFPRSTVSCVAFEPRSINTPGSAYSSAKHICPTSPSWINGTAEQNTTSFTYPWTCRSASSTSSTQPSSANASPTPRPRSKATSRSSSSTTTTTFAVGTATVTEPTTISSPAFSPPSSSPRAPPL